MCAYVCKYLYATRRRTNRKQQRSGVGIGILLAVCRSQGSKKWSQAGVASALGRCGDRGGWLPSGRGTRLLTMVNVGIVGGYSMYVFNKYVCMYVYVRMI